jgi:hypothetical protein
VLIVEPKAVGAVQRVAGKLGVPSYLIGETRPGKRSVQIA